MKKRLTFITILMLFCSTMFGQYVSHWGPVPTNFRGSMNLWAKISIDEVPQQSTDIEIGAFCGNELRGATKIQKLGNDYIVFLTIWGDKAYDIINFKLYDPSTSNDKVELLSDYTVDFKENDMIGSYGDYETLDFVPSYWNKVNIAKYYANMSVDAIIAINGIPQDRDNLEIAALCGNELRDVQRPIYDANLGKYVVFFVIGGAQDEVIKFQLYDHSEDAITSLMPLESEHTEDFVTDGTVGVTNPVTINFACPIAQIKETEEYFYTLAAAVEAATGGQTITLLRDTEGAGVVIDKNVTIDFGGFTYTFVSPAVGSTGTQTLGFQILKDNTVTLQNGTLNVAEAAGTDFAMLIQNYADLTITDMTLNGDNLDRYTIKDYDYSYVLSNNSGEVYIGGNTQILANPGAVEGDGHYGVAFDVCKYANYTAPVVTLGEDVTVEGKVEVTGGQLYTNAALNAVVKKTVEGSSTGWGTLSSPTAEGIAVFSTSTGHDFYQYVESAEKEWNNIAASIVNNSYTMDNGRGYLYANTDDTEVSFEGTLNYQDVNYSLSYTQKDLAGFNFIGNPFTHNITAAHLSGNKTEGYYVVGEDGTFQVRNTTEETIAPMQAVLVQATEAGNLTNLTIKKTARATQTREASNGALEIVVANTDYKDVAYVSFNDGIGLEKIGHQNANAPLVYVTAENKKFAIATMKQDVNEIPVSFVAKTMGQYTISVEAVDCEFNEMYLTDRMTGEKVNLLLEDYTFVATSNDNADRFVISFGTTKPESVAENFIYINNGNMIINNIEGNAVVRVLDVLGRPVAEYNVTESANISTATLSSGVYMIQMYDNNGVKVQKIVVE
ncbi:MAG: T9SS type A sorting domain-containing protein [Bacteroidales bacterium]|nr:T9SS type A sorting domain-containing protein [Bacteroidales bacterium]